jgi:hypothetical protein
MEPSILLVAALMAGTVILIWLFGRQPLWLLCLGGLIVGAVIAANLNSPKNLYAKHNFHYRAGIKVVR